MFSSVVKHLVKAYLKLGFFFYYKKIELYGSENIPKNKPVLLLSNHQNALIDALLIATQIKGFAYYLTRANVFNNKIIAKILNFFGLMPVYRKRDGYSQLEKNQAIFDYCADLFVENQKVLVFPEGNHNIARRVRSLSKGFTRIVFNALEKNPGLDLQILPLGLNYQKADDFPDSVAIHFGKTLSSQAYMLSDRNVDTKNLRSDIQNTMAELTTHIPVEGYAQTLKRLDEMQIDYLRPEAVNHCIESEFKHCVVRKKSRFESFKPLLKALLIMNLFLPYFLWKFAIQPKIKEPEFVATFRFTIGMTVVPLYLLLIAVILALVYGLTSAVIYLSVVLVIALLTVKL